MQNLKQMFDETKNKVANKIGGALADYYLSNKRLQQNLAYNKAAPLSLRMLSKSLIGDNTTVTEKDLTNRELRNLYNVASNSTDRYINLDKDWHKEYGNAIQDWANRYPEQLTNNSERYDTFEFDGHKGSLPQHLDAWESYSSPHIELLDYTKKDPAKQYAGLDSTGVSSAIRALFDKKYDLRHSIAQAYKKSNPGGGYNITDTYDFLELEDGQTYNWYKKLHDAARTKGVHYPVNINVDYTSGRPWLSDGVINGAEKFLKATGNEL